MLDGIARAKEVGECRRLAEEETASFILVVTECNDRELHRSRIEARERSIPGWYELDWPHVERSITTWEPVEAPHLVLVTTALLYDNLSALTQLLDATD